MRLSPRTLLALKNNGDKEAEEIFKDFIALSKFNSPPAVVAAYYDSKADKLSCCLIWDEWYRLHPNNYKQD